ncbi:hypothetical protein FQA39_LY13980 [Lamprigera yunnana]|nr:hypothetical protein FQA39_LY13980 [Lamprigera yunnana]
MLRSKWESLKKTNKKEYAKFKLSFYNTGGGSSVINIPLNSISNEVLAIIGIGASGRDTEFDSDAGIHFLYINIVNTPVYSCESFKNLIYATKCEILFIQKLWESAHLQLLLYLKILRSKKWYNPSCSSKSWNPVIETTQKQSSEVLEEVDLLTADSEAIKTQTPAEIADISHTPNNIMMRDNTINNKYILKRIRAWLKKIEFIDFQIRLLKEEAQRKAKKHELEMEILEVELKNKTVNKGSLKFITADKKKNRRGKVAKNIVVPINTYYAIELCIQTIDVLYNACKIPPAQEGDDSMNYDAQTLIVNIDQVVKFTKDEQRFYHYCGEHSFTYSSLRNPANRLRIEMGVEMHPSGVRTAAKVFPAVF